MKPQNLGPWVMKSSQSNFDLRSPSSYLARSYLIATVCISDFKLYVLDLRFWILEFNAGIP